MVCTIHQFSQGINLLKTGDGTWSSDGFSGKWEQKTEEIPSYIEDAIKADKFKGRSVSSSNPAITARVIEGVDKKFWSVVAVIARATDLSRPFSTYRYFWCEGKDNLYLIVGWLLEQENLPIFDPFVTTPKPIDLDENKTRKYIQQVNLIEEEISNPEYLKWLNKFKNPQNIILSPSSYTEKDKILIIDRVATKIARDKNRLTSWAFKVENLNKPEEFLVIQPASSQAYERLHSISNTPAIIVESPLESELKSVIQAFKDSKLTRQVFFNLEFVLSKLKDTQNSKELLEKIFDELGAIDAVNEQMHKAGRMELVTLRAILLPETLVEYLHYAHIEEKSPTNKINKILNSSNPIRKQSLDFQSILYAQIQLSYKELPNLIAKLRDGLITIIEESYKEKVSKNTLWWLAISKESVWNLGSHDLVQSVVSDLNNIFNDLDNIRILKGQNKLKTKLQELNLDIWKNLITDHWLNNSGIIHETCRVYQYLGHLFFELDYHILAYYFYIVSGVKVNSEILNSVREYQIKYKIDHVFGIPIPQTNNTSNLVPKLTIQPTTTRHNKKKISQFIILFLYVIIIILGAISFGQSLQAFIFIVFGFILGLQYFRSEQTRQLISKYSLPLIVSAFVVGTVTSKTSSNLGIQSLNPPVPTPSVSPTTETPSTPMVNENDKQFQAILDNAFKSFGKTSNAIKKIQDNIINDPELNDVLSQLNPKQKKDKFLFTFKKVIGLKENDSYTEIINNAKSSQSIKNKNQILTLIQSIYNYQIKNNQNISKPDGIIDLVTDVNKSPNSTMALLQADIKKQIK